MPHPTQVFLHSPRALRVEYLLDEERLILWWSPLAGESWDAADRNFSNRDNPLAVFDAITIPGCGLAQFERGDYDPWHTILKFKRQELHIAVRPDEACVLVWGGRPLAVDLKSGRDDSVQHADESALVLRHQEGGKAFEFTAATGPSGRMRHSPFRAAGASWYARAELPPGGVLILGAGLAGDGAPERLRALGGQPTETHLEVIEAALGPLEGMGRTVSSREPELDQFRRSLVRGLASMIDDSGTFRASLKAIYYLIWVRDAGFAFAFQSVAGWPHRLPELCRLFLENPTVARGDGVPRGRMFAQLINRDYGKYEEDGIFYVLWTLFTHWTQTGDRSFFEGEHRALLEDALEWVERRAFDHSRGLFGGYFADETPALGSRDYGWDFAVGKPSGDECIRHDGRRFTRSYDTYLNTVMHSAWSMMAAATGEQKFQAKADELWGNLSELYSDRVDGLPPYGDLLAEDGTVERVRKWGPVSSVYVWGLALPNFLPLDDRDAMTGALLDAILERPAMHWINGICAVVAAADPWLHGEERLVATLRLIREEAVKEGEFLPMAGAMPEKLHAPAGSLHHDIRPQGFAMAAWLAAWSSLGVRRLPYGLAVRPAKALDRLENFAWKQRTLDFEFPDMESAAGLEINGQIIAGTLQIPEEALRNGRNTIRPAAASPGPVLLRSSALLQSVSAEGGSREFRAECFGPTEFAFAGGTGPAEVRDGTGAVVAHSTGTENTLTILRLFARGTVSVRMPRPA